MIPSTTTIHDKNFQGSKEGDQLSYFWNPFFVTHKEDKYYDTQMDPRTYINVTPTEYKIETWAQAL